jgi:endo-1,3(4)-beta-glucanase
MLPIVSTTAYIRTPKFVREEYERWFATGRAAEAGPAWQAVVMADWAVADPKASWKHFTGEKFQVGWLYDDLGTSLAWYLWYAAALGGAE